MFDSKEAQRENKVPTILIELCDRRGSGFILDGTRNTNHEVELDSPTARFLPNTGFRSKKVTDASGKITTEYEPIRYIKNQPIISTPEQDMKGIKPNRSALEDKIIVKAGRFSISKEGSYVGLYNYLMESFYNESNADRPKDLLPLYRVVDLTKQHEQMNEMAILEADAIQFISSLFTKIGAKEYKYSEEKINNLCTLFVIYAETMPAKISALMSHAKRDPEGFLRKAEKFEQVTMTEVAQALELGVIKFQGNTAIYVEKDKVIASVGTGNMSQDKKIEKLSDLLKTEEYKAVYEEFQIELEAAKEKLLK